MDSSSPALEAFLLGTVDFDVTIELQQQLVEEAYRRGDGQVTLLLCEHPTIITIGRNGSLADVATQSTPVRSGQIEVRWVNRGGGALLHCPGQLAVYPIVPLRWHGFAVPEFLDRFRAGLVESLGDLNVRCRSGVLPLPDCHDAVSVTAGAQDARGGPRYAIFGRTGQLAAFGVSIRHGISYCGAYLNVCPAMGWFRLVQNDAGCALGRVLARTPPGPAAARLHTRARRDRPNANQLPDVRAARIGSHAGRPGRAHPPAGRRLRLRSLPSLHGPSAVAKGRRRRLTRGGTGTAGGGNVGDFPENGEDCLGPVFFRWLQGLIGPKAQPFTQPRATPCGELEAPCWPPRSWPPTPAGDRFDADGGC